MASFTPPQAAPTWTHSADDVLRLTKEAIANDTTALDKVAALKPEDCNFETASLQTAIDAAVEPLSFYQNVSPSKELRDASNEAEVLVRDYGVDASMRLDVFQAKLAAEKNIKASGQKLDAEEQRLVDKMLLDGKRAGLALPEAQRDELMKLKKELSQASLEFSKNFNEENSTVTFTLEQLKGVPADVTSGYTKRADGGKEVYDVTMKTPDIFPIFRTAENPETRRLASEAYDRRLEINAPLLDKMLGLRRKIASILGYPTWADYITEFLDDLEQKLRPIGARERVTLLALKQEEHAAKGYPFDGELYMSDFWYYSRRLLERELELDDQKVKEHFPVNKVVPAILEIYQQLLGVQFVEVKSETLWHPDVQQFAVWENGAKDESGFVGYCYLDLFPREAKYSHAAVWPLLPGYTRRDGKRSYPLAAMVANLAKPTPTTPALMQHSDVVTFFHEMGHVFHGLLSKTRFARFHGTAVARDFVEAPSQMLENCRYVNVGLYYLRQVFFAKFDIKVHTDKEATDYTALWNDLREAITTVKFKQRAAGQGSFNHIA
ncbi:hypothetical protein EVJ58_g360, partial [Rhodofomes roseus]